VIARLTTKTRTVETDFGVETGLPTARTKLHRLSHYLFSGALEGGEGVLSDVRTILECVVSADRICVIAN
jgi:hypothetical protein